MDQILLLVLLVTFIVFLIIIQISNFGNICCCFKYSNCNYKNKCCKNSISDYDEL